eukprot:403339805
MRKMKISLRIIPREDFELRRYHAHKITPYQNDLYNRKMLSRNQLSYYILIAAFLTGYVYARLSQDIWSRRKAYARYTNFMMLFDKFSAIYDENYRNFMNFIISFDHTKLMWQMRTQKTVEYKVKKQLKEEILKKQTEGDEVSEIIMSLDQVSGDSKDLETKKQ